MGGGGEEILDEVLLLDAHADLALPSSSLGTVQRHGIAFDVAGVRDADDHFFFCDEIFQTDLRLFFNNLRAAIVFIGLANFHQLVFDDGSDQCFTREHGLQVFDLFQHFLVLFDELGPFKLRQALEPHVEDRCGLNFGKAELSHQPRPRFVR